MDREERRILDARGRADFRQRSGGQVEVQEVNPFALAAAGVGTDVDSGHPSGRFGRGENRRGGKR